MKLKLLKFGIFEGIEVHISKVKSGLECHCFCPCCGIALIAKKGKLGKPQEHFAHKSADQCEFAYETSIHFEAKRLLEIEKKISLPYRRKSFEINSLNSVFQSGVEKDKIGIIENRLYKLDNIKSEKRLHDIVPDIKATIEGKEILIEIAVTSKVKELKKEKIRQIGIPTIEIDFSKMNRQINDEDFRLNLFHNVKNKKWIYNSKDDALITEILLFRNMLERKIFPFAESYLIKGTRNYPTIFNCPNPFAKKEKIGLDYCRKCPFLISVQEFNVWCGAKNYRKIEEIIMQEYGN